jgi:Flp pilus assembly protein TadB
MSHDQDSDRGARRPRIEPEIIPPDRNGNPPRDQRMTWTVHGGDGVHRIYVMRPSLPSVILALLVLGAIALLAVLAVAGMVLLWLPILIGAIVVALLAGAIRYRWRRLRSWLSKRSPD